MIRLDFLKNKTVVVLGLGRSGLATAKALHGSGAHVVAWDDGAIGRDQAMAEGIALTPMEGLDWGPVDLLVLSPGIPLNHPAPHPAVIRAQAHSVPIVCDIDLLLQALPSATFIGITGTNGKSTTTTLLGHLLSKTHDHVQIGGNVGIPVLALEHRDAGCMYVLELSSFQLELMHTKHLDCAVLLNITPDHLERHGSMSGYVAAKKHLFSLLRPQGKAIVGVDDAHTLGIYSELSGDGIAPVPFSVTRLLDHGVSVQDGVLIDRACPDVSIDLTTFRSLKGQHNWQNAAAAYLVANHFNDSVASIASGLHTFGGLAHRQECVGTVDDITFVNDSKATNAEATIWALSSYQEQPVYWIAGGRAKEGGIESLEPFFSKLSHVFLIGEAAPLFAKTIDGQVPYTTAQTLDNAVKLAHDQIKKDGVRDAVVLLSPACASLDQFKDFAARGDAFKAAVNNLQKKA